MKFRGLDADGDWMLGQGLGSYAREEDALALSIATRLRSVYGNCFFDTEFGINYQLRMDPNHEDDLYQDIQAMVQQTDGVVLIRSISKSLNRQTRALGVSMRLQTIYDNDFQTTISNLAGALNA